jgi:hypothetical protein
MKYLLLALLLIIPFPSSSSAQTFFELAAGETFEFSSFDTSDTIFSTVENGRSYCCEVFHVGQSNVVPRFEEITSSGGTLENKASRGRNAPWLGAGTNSVDSRQCFRFVAAESSPRTFITLDIEAVNPPIPNARVRCRETTLFGGFNTSVTDFNFIEITNTLASTDIDGTINVKVQANANVAGGEVLNSTLTLNAGERKDVDVHSVVGKDFGPVVITHNGPPGSIRAVNAQYRIVTQSPLDFEPVLSVPFREGLR